MKSSIKPKPTTEPKYTTEQKLLPENYQNTSQPRSTGYYAYKRQNNEYYGRNHANQNTTQPNPQTNINVSWKDREPGQNEDAAFNIHREQNSPQIHETSEKERRFKIGQVTRVHHPNSHRYSHTE